MMREAGQADRLYIDFRKWPDRGHWHFTVYPMGEDVHGRWYRIPQGSRVQRGSEPVKLYPRTSAMLIPSGSCWWVAYWNSDDTQPHELYIDVATPPRLSSGRATMVDLDLDVVRGWEGKVEIIDRDEFLLHQRQLGYPREIVAAAERTAGALANAVARREEPFGEVGDAWLRRGLGGT